MTSDTSRVEKHSTGSTGKLSASKIAPTMSISLLLLHLWDIQSFGK